MDTPRINGWNAYEKLVLHELDRLTKCAESTDKKLQEIKNLVDDNRMKVARLSAVAGFIAGAIPVGVAILLKVLF